ncbi:cryptochrome/deoxyribodipyrimidine photo-lyase family protein [Ascidiimonas sp. W6]|uniref:cryptochrome/deoxyribodipyrimidine photo-lyase family protein n=1 Tax=Ascidiimonas meishanensis TaxID=3128903 RepID=UPI0030EE7D02
MNIVWLKRDLRLTDHEPIYRALETSSKVLLLYCFEPFILNDPHYSERHFNFIKESLNDLNTELFNYSSSVLVVEAEITNLLSFLLEKIGSFQLHSSQETGLNCTFKRDKKVAKWCKLHDISWSEYGQNGVKRRINHRKTWKDDWYENMNAIPFTFQPLANQLFEISEIHSLEKELQIPSLKTPKSIFQKGGTKEGIKYLHSFLHNRITAYNSNISKPEASRKSCSRLSPYIAWGNLSVRQVYQSAIVHKEKVNNKRNLTSFTSRLRWQAHFIQKFESECSMEFLSINKGYHKLQKTVNRNFHDAWISGKTGFPLVDAAMRCLNQTGYLNFRMRALLVSFYTHLLWQPWQNASCHLASQFLDFEPGIHYPQLQMQAGETGINLLRIYNPIKNSYAHDPHGTFILKWIPELEVIPPSFIHEPWKLTMLEQQFYNFKLGVNYPEPIIQLNEAWRKASDLLWSYQKELEVIKDAKRILKKHTIPERPVWDED